MGLDDFLSEEIEPAQPLELPAEEASSDASSEMSSDASLDAATESSFDDGGLSDDDLFDLRTLDEIEELVASEGDVDPDAVGSLADNPVEGAVDAPLDGGSIDSDLLDFPTREAAGPDPLDLALQAASAATSDADEAAAEASTASATLVEEEAPADGEFDIDEDLFDFGSPEDENLDSLLALGNDLTDVLSEIDSVAHPTSELESIADAPTEDTFTAAPMASEPVAARGADDAGELRPQARPADAGDGPASITVVDPVALRSRPSWLAIASVLGANFILLFFAWSASQSLHAHLSEVRKEIRTQPQAPYGQGPEALPAQEPSTATESESAALEDAPSVLPAQDASAIVLPALPGPAGLALEVAEQEIDAERFGAARRRLFGLLATIDGVASEQREEIEARALYLIGDTYARQATLGEGRP